MVDGGWGSGFWGNSAWGMSSLLRDVNESVAAVDDAPPASNTVSTVFSDSISAVDAYASRGVFRIPVSEASTIADSSVGSFVFLRSVDESVVGTDQILATPIYLGQFSDAATGIDQTSPANSVYRALVSDLASGQDSSSVTLVIPVIASESLFAVDSARVIANLNVSSAEGLTVSDVLSAAQTFASSLSDQASGAESLSTQQVLFPVFVDRAIAIDFAGSTDTGSILFAAVTEYIFGQEGLELQSMINSAASEVAAVTDVAANARMVFVGLSADGAVASDSANPSGTFYAIVSPSLQISDGAVRRLLWEPSSDDQTPGWQNTNSSQSASWQEPSISQSPNWQPTNNLD